MGKGRGEQKGRWPRGPKRRPPPHTHTFANGGCCGRQASGRNRAGPPPSPPPRARARKRMRRATVRRRGRQPLARPRLGTRTSRTGPGESRATVGGPPYPPPPPPRRLERHRGSRPPALLPDPTPTPRAGCRPRGETRRRRGRGGAPRRGSYGDSGSCISARREGVSLALVLPGVPLRALHPGPGPRRENLGFLRENPLSIALRRGPSRGRG